MTVTNPSVGNTTAMVPDMILNLGPTIGSNTSVCGMMNLEVVLKNQTVCGGTSTSSTSVNTIQASASSIKSAVSTGASQIGGIVTSMVSAQSSLGSTMTSGRQYIQYFNIGLNAIYAVAVACSALAVGSILLIQFCKVVQLNCFLYFACFFLCIFMILGFLLSSILFPVSVIFMQTCDVINTLLNVNGTLGNFNQISANSSTYLSTCLYGDGDIIGNLTNGQLGSLTTLSASIAQVAPFFPNSNTTSITIPLWNFFVKQYIAGTASTSLNPLPGYPIAANITLNSDVNYNFPQSTQASVNCKQTIDVIQLSSVNCTAGTTILKTTDPAGTYLSTGACIGIADFSAAQSTITNRYSSPNPFLTCSSSLGTTIASTYTALTAHYNSVNSGFNAMLSDNTIGLGNLNSLDNTLSQAIWALTAPIQQMNTTVGQVLAYINDPVIGLVPNLNCTIIGNGLQRFYNDMCVGLVTSFYQASLVLVIASIFCFLGTLFLFCLAKRMNIGFDDGSKNQQY